MAYELHRSLRPSRHRLDTLNTQVVLLCSFHNNDVTWSQFQVMIVLLQSFIESLTVVLPFSIQCGNQPLTLHADSGASMAWA